jgi:general stress protein CsbA
MYWFTGLMGLALGVAPFVLGYSNHPTAMWASIILGVIALAASAYKAFIDSEGNWAYWVVGVAGILAIAAPFVLGFTTLANAMWTFIVLGVILFLAAAYELFYHQPRLHDSAGSRA